MKKVYTIRTAILITISLVATIFLLSIPEYLHAVQVFCEGDGCNRLQLRSEYIESFKNSGVSLKIHSIYFVIIEAIILVVFWSISILMVWKKEHDSMILVVAFMLIFFPTTFSVVIEMNAWENNMLGLAAKIPLYLGTTSIFICFYLFPNGRFYPSFTRYFALLWVVIGFLGYFTPENWIVNQKGGYIFFLSAILSFLIVTINQIYRFRKYSNQEEKQQLKFVLFGFILSISLVFLHVILLTPSIHNAESGSYPLFLAVSTGFYLSLLLIPVSVFAAMIKYRLWDIDILINRALVYAIITVLVATIYAIMVGFLESYLSEVGLTFISAVILVFVFLPIYHKVQQTVNRMLFGRRDDPYRIISKLSKRLGYAIESEDVLDTILDTVTQAFNVPHAEIHLNNDNGYEVSAVKGKPIGRPMVMPLLYKSEIIGQLLLSPRSPGESWSSVDLQLLEELVRQVGTAIHSARVTKELKRSNQYLLAARERLVNAREEERKRIRHNLHDGVIPSLAALTLKSGAALRLLNISTDRAANVLQEIIGNLEENMQDIRALVRNLRPPAIDQLGLIDALRERIKEFESNPEIQSEGIKINYIACSSLKTKLPAAVEVATYMIVQEAVLNVWRHARAKNCNIFIERRVNKENDELYIRVEDDGKGFNKEYLHGIGITSMRERTQELGGKWSIEKVSDNGGTCVTAILPLLKD
jgi:signal transduction histidine kinase